MVRRDCALVLATVLCVHTGTVYATVTRVDCFSSFTLQAPSASDSIAALSPSVAADFADTQFARLGRLISQPRDFDSPFAASQQEAARILPAVPTAGGLAIVGFLSVSFVRDRKTWLTAAASTVFLIGAAAGHVSKFAMRVAGFTHNSANASPALMLETRFWPSSHSGGDYYGDLLSVMYRCGGNLASIPTSSVCTCNHAAHLRQDHSWCALPGLSIFSNVHLICAGGQTRRFTISTPLIAFQQLARGPPALACIDPSSP